MNDPITLKFENKIKLNLWKTWPLKKKSLKICSLWHFIQKLFEKKILPKFFMEQVEQIVKNSKNTFCFMSHNQNCFSEISIKCLGLNFKDSATLNVKRVKLQLYL